MKWNGVKGSIEAFIELIREHPKATDSQIADMLKNRFPDQSISQKSIEHKRQALGMQKDRYHKIVKIPHFASNNQELDYLSKMVLNWLSKEPLDVGEISRRIDRSKETVIKLLDALRLDGYDVSLAPEAKQVILKKGRIREFKAVTIEKLYRDFFRILLVSDTHFGSKFQQPSLLHTAYAIAEKEQVDFAIHLGDVVEGEGLYRGQEYELFLRGIDEQRDYVIEHYPRTKAFKTYMLSGSHDLIFKKRIGYNMVEAICKERGDLKYRGDVSARFHVKKCVFETIHPSGGMPYGRSYRLQRLIEGLVGDIMAKVRESDKTEIPHFYLSGHLHQAFFMPYMGFMAFLVPCFQSLTPYLRGKGYYPQLGFWIVEVRLDAVGDILKITPHLYDMTSQAKENDY